MLNVDRDNSKTTWNFDMRSKRVDSVNSGLKHIKKCQKGSGPPPYGLKASYCLTIIFENI